MNPFSIFAQAYGSGDYGSQTYEGSTTTGSSTGSTTGSKTGTTTGAAGTTHTGGGGGGGQILTNTGFDLVLAATFACIIIFAALVTRFWKKKPASPTDK
jgi:hypothetical protein